MNRQVAEILELSVAEKIQIVEDIWDSIRNSPEELPLSEREKTELDKRLAGYEQNPNDGIEWKTLKHKFISYVSVITICFFSAVNIFAQTDSDQDEYISNSKIKTCIVLAETGDIIQSVAERFNLPAIELAKFNGLFLVSRLQKGRKVRVFYTAGRKPEGCVSIEKDKKENTEEKYKTVSAKLGDTVKSLACRNNVSPDEVGELNKLSVNSHLTFAQNLRIPIEQNHKCEATETAD